MTRLFGLRDSAVEVNSHVDKWSLCKFIYQENLSHFLTVLWLKAGLLVFYNFLHSFSFLFSFKILLALLFIVFGGTVKSMEKSKPLHGEDD